MADPTVRYGPRMRLKRQELVFEDSTENSQIAVLQELDRPKYHQLQHSLPSPLQRPGSPRTRSDIPEAPSLNNDVLMNILPAKIRARIFSALPLRVLKLPEMRLTERSAVVEHIIQNRLNNLTEEIYRRCTDILGETYPRGLPLKNDSLQNAAVSAFVEDVTKFAVLSHTWGRDEPNHEDFLLKRNTTNSQGYKKLVEFCRIAHEQYGVEFAWADTVCINKLSSSELDESIRSMFAWYRESFICIIHLADTETLLDLPLDWWFARGWTLQELLAPPRIKFYNKSWQPLTNLRNEKLDPKGKLHYYHPDYATHLHSFDEKYLLQLELLGNGISAATSIPIHCIYDFQPGLRSPPLPERMKWIAQRTTTRPEDMSYSMMGVLGVSISVAYGEGSERAFFRLFQAVLEVDWSPSWFLWGGKPIASHIHSSRMIPSSPTCYSSWDPQCDLQSSFQKESITSRNQFLVPQWDRRKSRKREPIALTNAGLPVNVLVVPARVTYIASRPATSGEIQAGNSANITCPLSKDIVMADVPREDIHDGEHQFALGILDYHVGISSYRTRVYGILLHRYHGRYRMSPTDALGPVRYTEWVCEEWERWETGGMISFELDWKLTKVEDWTEVKIPKPALGWITYGADITPKIEFRSLYL